MAVNSCTPHVGGQTGCRARPKITPCPLGCLAASQEQEGRGSRPQRCRSTSGSGWNTGSSYFLLLFWKLTTPCPDTPCLFLKPFLFL